MEWWGRLGVRSNQQAVANARAATTALSRRRVEHDEVALYLRERFPEAARQPAYVALDAPAAEAAR